MTYSFKTPATVFATAILALFFVSSLQAQSSTDQAAKSPNNSDQHELIKYEKHYTLQKEHRQQSFSIASAAVKENSVKNVYLAENTLTPDLKNLKQVAPAPPKKEHNYAGTLSSRGSSGDDAMFGDDSNSGKGGASVNMGSCGNGTNVFY